MGRGHRATTGGTAGGDITTKHLQLPTVEIMPGLEDLRLWAGPSSGASDKWCLLLLLLSEFSV